MATAVDSSAPGVSARPRLLLVDDEPAVLEGLQDVLRRSFDVRVATSGAQGLEALRVEPDGFSVVISDMRMPHMNGSEFLRQARAIAPDSVRMLLTGHADLETAIKAVNGARLFRFLTKPCDTGELLRACAAALGQHRLQVAERELLEQTLRGSLDALVDVLALANPAAFGRATRVKRLAGGLARTIGLANVWEVEVAAMLTDIGAVTLPQATAEKFYAGALLSESERMMVQRVPAVSRHLLSRIPRLEGVLEILDQYLYDGSGAGLEDVNAGAQVLRIALDYDVLESGGLTGAASLGVMRSRRQYDASMLESFCRLVGLPDTPVVRELSLGELSVGVTFADDVRDLRGVLLIARGQAASDHLLARLRNMPAGSIQEPLRVFASDARERA